MRNIEATERSQRVQALVGDLVARARVATPQALGTRPKEGEWTAMEVLAHVAEIVPFWARQAREVSEQGRDSEPFGRSTLNSEEDPDRIGAVKSHGRDSLAEMEGLLRAGLHDAVNDLTAIRPDRWTQKGKHLNGQVRTVAEIVDQLLIEHLETHRQQLDAILHRP